MHRESAEPLELDRREVAFPTAAFRDSSGTGQVAAMQRPDVTPSWPRGRSKSLPAPSLAVVVLNRMAFGPRPGDVDAFNALGASDEERLDAYLDQQLAPGTVNDAGCDAKLAAGGFTTLAKSRPQLWADHVVANVERYRPFEESRTAAFLRAVYSRRQLLEVLLDFWHNHFNVYGRDYWVAPMFVHYDRDVIRAHALGSFRAMLEGVAQSTAMLYYLDNYTSSNAGPNENWARELFELHTLGAESYFGVRQQSEVPLDPGGVPIAYVDADVYEATRAFTGWTVRNSSSNPAIGNTGEFFYRDEWHDRFQKTVLGVFMPADQPPLADGLQVLDALARHPGTARHIAGKLCRRLVADEPPAELVEQAAAVFAAGVDATDQIAQTVRFILSSNAFRTIWGEKVKRPFEISVSALRAADTQVQLVQGDSETNSFLSSFRSCGQPLYEWVAPDGYPDLRQSWQSPSPRVMSWRHVNWLIGWGESSGSFQLDVLGQTPSWARSANQLADFWIQRLLGRPMPSGERLEIVEFMAQGHNPDLALPLDSSASTRDRLRAMVGLIFMAPSFLWR